MESRYPVLFIRVERRFEGGGAHVAQTRMPLAKVLEAFDVLAKGLGGLPVNRHGFNDAD